MTVTGHDFTGRKVVITGGGSGTGACMAHHFAASGAQVIIAGRRKSALEAVSEGCDTIQPFVCDVTKERAVADLFDFAQAYGVQGKGTTEAVPDIVIANAGIAASAPLDKTTRALWDQIIAVNLTGPFLTLRDGLLRMKAAKCQRGRLIAIASMTAKRAYPYVSAYAASKHGVLGLVKSAALEVAAIQASSSDSAQKNITVNAICPGYLDTEMTQSSIAKIAEKTGLSEEQAAEKLHSFSPQKRLFTAGEVAQAALFLASPAASGINGQALSIDGGETW
jgi:NAD(P)-dependent dehydrogenase (short-subunit alcohol dehydrogenase family)